MYFTSNIFRSPSVFLSTTEVNITVERTQGTEAEVKVNYATFTLDSASTTKFGLSAAVTGEDFRAASGVIVFKPQEVGIGLLMSPLGLDLQRNIISYLI